MKIKQLNIYTSNLIAQKEFYHNKLGFKIEDESATHFTIKAGHSLLSFTASENSLKYHYCFLIPSNQLDAATNWLQNKTDLIIDKDGTIQHQFDFWNAAAIYFYDADGNVAELIVRYDLKNDLHTDFGINHFLSVNEIGLPTKDNFKTQQTLLEKANSPQWEGNLERFGTNGTQEGLFLLINNNIKKTWFPTEVPTHSAPFEARIEVDKNEYFVDFSDGVLKI